MGNMVTIALILDNHRKRQEKQDILATAQKNIRKKSLMVPLLKSKRKKSR